MLLLYHAPSRSQAKVAKKDICRKASNYTSMKIKLSKSQWLRIGQSAGWQLPDNYQSIRSQRFVERDTNHTELANAEAEQQMQHKLKQDITRNHEIINPPTRGKMHRCKFCWTDVSQIDNGFIPFDKAYPHDKNCPYKDKF